MVIAKIFVSQYIAIHGKRITIRIVIFLFKNGSYFQHDRVTQIFLMIIKSLYPLRAKKTFIRKNMGHTAVSAIKASSVTL